MARCNEKLGLFKNGNKKFPPEYVSWMGMKARCNNPKNNRFYCYGMRGVKVCKRWEKSFAAFLTDMGPRLPGYSLDRIDSNKGYSPKNCRWATRKEQGREKATLYTANGITQNISDWAKLFGVANSAITYHLLKGKTFQQVHAHFTSGNSKNKKRSKSAMKPKSVKCPKHNGIGRGY